tara:strand:+ start:24 stop:473 length:450 start_codon:yes stop_codon:yes gene_type:complete
MKLVFKKFLIIFPCILMTHCSPIIGNRGYVFDDKLFEQIEIGKTNVNQVVELLGTPSTTSTIDAKTWYYIYSKAETMAFYQPSVSQRRIMTVGFNNDNKVSFVEEYGLQDGNIIAFNSESTPTRGRELTILQQLFGNLGRLGAGNIPGN